MRVEANVTSGLLATDSSAVELVPLLQAEVRKLREMLTIQRIPVERERDLLESRVVVEMRKRVSELETQLAEREKLIDSLDLMRREELMEEEEELERLFLTNGEGRDFRGENSYNLYKNDVKYNNYNNDYDMNYDTYTNSNNRNHDNNIINHLNNNNGHRNGHIDNDSTDNRSTNYYHNTHSSNSTLHNENSIISANHDRTSWDFSRINREHSRILGPGSPSKLKSISSYGHNNNNNHSNNHHNGYSSNSGQIQGQSRSVRSLFPSRNRSQEADNSIRNIINFNDSFSAPPPPPPLPSPTPLPTPTTLALAPTPAPAAVARSQPVVLLSEDAVDVSHPRVINLNQVSNLHFDKLLIHMT